MPEGPEVRRQCHFVFGRDGRPCVECGTVIEPCDMAGRRNYTCATCQR